MRASIDIGTNTVRLLVAYSKNLIPKKKLSKIGRLGEGSNRHLSQNAVNRVVNILRYYKNICQDSYNIAPSEIKAVATSAAREADNAKELIDIAKHETGIEIKIISGTEEGRLTAAGALKNLSIEYPALVVDIGGGSTEIITVSDKSSDVVSIRIGALTCKEKFLSDPPSNIQIAKAKQWIDSKLGTLKLIRPKSLIATAGTPTSIAAILLGLDKYDSKRVHGYKTNLAVLSNLFEKLKKIPSKNILSTYKIIQRGREDLLVAGSLILIEIMKRFKDELIVSDEGLLEGILLCDF